MRIWKKLRENNNREGIKCYLADNAVPSENCSLQLKSKVHILLPSSKNESL